MSLVTTTGCKDCPFSQAHGMYQEQHCMHPSSDSPGVAPTEIYTTDYPIPQWCPLRTESILIRLDIPLKEI